MSEKTPSDAASDSDFDEQDLTAEEDDEDSIAADEDVADEEEINSLVKESEMSLEELLASYGVSASEVTGRAGKSQASTSSTSTITRSSRLRSARQVSKPAPPPPTQQEVQELQVVTESSPIKRSRRSNISASPSLSTSGDQESHYSAPPSPHRISPVRLKELAGPQSIEDNPATSLQPNLDTKQTLSSDGPLSHPRQALSDLSHLASRKRRRATSLTLIPDKHGPSEHGHGSRAMVPQQEDVSTVEPTNPTVASPHGDFTPTHKTGLPDLDSEGEEADLDRTQDEEDMVKEDGNGGNRESDQAFSSRFWKKAIGAGESPHSYNSEDDEDYAPSEESGPDWRGEIRVGDEYQADVASSVASSLPDPTSDWWDTRRFENESSRLWQPDKLPEAEVIHFERLFAQTVMGTLPNERTVDDEEALFLLMRCNYDPDEALQRLRFRTVAPSEIPGYMDTWSEADSAAFEKGFALYSKDFRQIRDTRLRHKTVGELVHYYYLWKKTARHDEFARVYRRDKRKSPHPSITDFMDYLVLEQEASAESYPYTMNSDQFHVSNHNHHHHHHHHRHHHPHYHHPHLSLCGTHKTVPSTTNALPTRSEGSERTTSDRRPNPDPSWTTTEPSRLSNDQDKASKFPQNLCTTTDSSSLALSVTTTDNT